MVYKTLSTDFYYENSGITSLSYYITADNGTIYTGKAFNPNGIKINVRKAIDDWLVNEMPDFREYDGVMVRHEDAFKVFGLRSSDGTLLEEYGVFLTYEDNWLSEITYRGIDGKADPRQKIFVGVLSDSPVDVVLDMKIKCADIEFERPFWFEYLAGTDTICYTANTDFTLVSYDGGWFTVTQTKADEFTGCLHFTYTTNENHSERDGTLCMEYQNFRDETEVRCFPVVQQRYSGYMYFDLEDGFVGQGGGRISLPYTTNYYEGEYRVTADGGAIVISYNNGHVVLSVPSNNTEDYKYYNVNVYSTIDGSLIETAVVRQETSYELDYLTIEPLDTGFVLVNKNISTGGYQFQISRDNGLSWETITTVTEYPGTLINVTAGQDILLKGNNLTNWEVPEEGTGTKITFGSGYYPNANYGENYIDGARFNLKGNIMSMVYGDDFRGQKTLVSGGTFFYMFNACDKLISAEHLVLPATDLTQSCYYALFYNCSNMVAPPAVLPAVDLTGAEGCYYDMFTRTKITYAPDILARNLPNKCCGYMFARCTSLIEAPEIRATSVGNLACFSMFSSCTSMVTPPSKLSAEVLADGCYEYMFYNCSSLTTAPQIMATTMAEECCMYMFQNCTSLTNAPVLFADVLAEACYYLMFNGCSNLARIECLATDITAMDCTYNWVSGVKATGTFIKAPSMSSWTSGNSGIPSGWTVQDAV